jgi:phthiocerol/phenolphthiocerol synthesis type-I polyketide synthase A
LSATNAAPADRRGIITEALRKIDDLTARLEVAERGDTEPIAVVGMGCRFPGGVNSPTDYWRLLQEGASGIVRVPAERWDADTFYSADYTVPGTICSRDGGFLTSWRPDEFDAEFFGISPREAAGMDPQQRLLLEVAWEALENAGITAQAIRGSQTSVFVGVTTNDYYLTFAGGLRPEDIDPHIPFGNASNFAAGRLSYFLGAHGPAVVIDTACSSSLVTVHLACQSLRRRESDQALAAGVNLILSPENSIACSRWGMLAPDGRCKTFDADADGYVRSEGAGVVVLKRLSDALRDGDSVLAVVRGSAVNQDGPSSGQTVPNGPAQQAVLRQAVAASRLAPADIDYIEAHGTGTALGDPIELDALSQVFGERGGAAPLVVGSVKTNLGHLESAAGIAGFIKTVLSVGHGHIPAHLNFSQLTPHASAGASRFTVAAQPMPWPAVGRARRAGVSSFGVSGTNAHVVVEQPPVAEPAARRPEPVVSTLVVSGKSAARVASTAGMLAEWMAGEGAGVPLADVAHTVNHHRTRHKAFAAVCARDHAQAVAGLKALAVGDTAQGVVRPHVGLCGHGTVFVYSGQGAHWTGMGRRLLADEPAFAAAVVELEPVFVEQVGFSLKQVIAGGEVVSGDARVQPVVMGLQLALTELWRSYGVKPDAVIGHSMGEVTAAVVAGALSPADGLKVIATRSALMSRLAGKGAVALLELDADATSELVADFPEVSLAGYVSPRQTVIAGPVAPVDEVIAVVTERDRFARRVNMEVASHTALMDPILPELRAALADLNPERPAIPFFSTVVDGATAPRLDAEYWVNNVRQPARVSQAVAAAAADHATFVEISAHPILTHAITESVEPAHHHSIGTLTRDGDDTIAFHSSLNAVHTVLPLQTPHPPEPHPVLPPTPWHHTSHWITIDDRMDAAGSKPRPGTVLGHHVAVSTTPPVHLWQARLVPEVHGAQPVPVSVLLQTLSAAAAELGQTQLADVRFENPIVVDQPRVVQVIVDGQSVTVSSSLAADTPTDHWLRHVSARISHESPAGQVEGSRGVPQSSERHDAASIESMQRQLGIEGQPVTWSIGSCRSAPGELHADVDLPEASTVTLLDAAARLACLLDGSNPQLMVPVAVESVRFGAEVTDKRGSVEVYRRGGGDGDELIVDIVVTAPDGSFCVDIRSLRYVAVEASHLPATHCDNAWTFAHAIEWHHWDDHAGALQTPDDRCTVAVLGESSSARSLADQLADVGYSRAEVGAARCVIYVADAGPSDTAETDIDCAVRLSADVAGLVRRLTERDDDNPATLWIITRGVRDGISDAAVRQSGLWGMAGVVRAEQPQLWGGLVDIEAGHDAHLDIANCASALSTILHTPAKTTLALRDGQFFAPALAPVSGQPVRQPFRCRPDAAYLITGGLGALGLLMAAWLVDRGARRLVLAGRTPLPPRRDWGSETIGTDAREKIAAIRALEMRGVNVEAVALDVGSRDAVAAMLATRDDEGATPIRGVIHAAGVTEGQLLTEISDDRLRRTMWPKIAGAQVLHEAFPPGCLDFLFLTASAGTVFGVPGQGAYASANAYLDGLARARHQQGCHTVSLDWVAWQGLGFAAEAHVVLHELERVGSRPLTADEAFAAWEYVARYPVAQAVIAPMPSSAAPASDSADVLSSAKWSHMTAEEALSELEAGLRTILARELALPEAEFELDRPFAEMGLNSVMAMTVRRETEKFVGFELSVTMLWNHPTVESLATYLVKKLFPAEDSYYDIDALPESTSSVLDDLFDIVESS